MEPLRPRLEEVRQRLGIRWEVLERDYLLSWVLAGINTVPELRETLVFKGGTALKKCYFGDYRFSEDLDFTGREGVTTGDAMEELMRLACEAAEHLVGEYAPVELSCGRYMENNPHPDGQEAFQIRARLPWHRDWIPQLKSRSRLTNRSCGPRCGAKSCTSTESVCRLRY